MSGRSILLLALVGSLAAPAVAQQPPEVTMPQPVAPPQIARQLAGAPVTAPMPREKADGAIELEFSFGIITVKVVETETGSFSLGTALAGAAHEAAGRPCCAADCCRKPAVAAPSAEINELEKLQQLVNELQRSARLAESEAPWTPVPVSPCPAPGFAPRGLMLDRSPIPTIYTPPPCCVAPVVPLAPMAPPVLIQRVGDLVKVIDVSVTETCPPCPLPPVAPNPLLGTWYRDAGVAQIAVTFTHDEMTVRMSQRDDGNLITLTVTAQYTITKDGLVYGAITGADVEVKSDSKAGAAIGMELAELSLWLQELVDRPFSFRTKATSAGLMVSQLKFASSEEIGGKELMVLGGLYKCAKDGKVPTPAAPKGSSGVSVGAATGGALVGSALRAAVGSPVGSAPGALVGNDEDRLVPAPPRGEPIQRVGIDFTFNPPVIAPPYTLGTSDAPASAIGGTPAGCPASPRTLCDDPMKSMAAGVFGQLLREADKTPAVGGMTLPSPRYLEHYPQYFAPDAAFPLPRELACQQVVGTVLTQPVVPAKPGIVGTWVRDIGSKRCVVKVAADHLTMTVSEAQDLEGQTVTAHLTLTADYYLTRDGLTAVGLLTGVDAKIDGDLPAGEAEAMMQKLGEIQKVLEDKPFAMTFRVYGDVLVIGNVRMQSVGGQMEIEPAAYIGGRYTSAGDKPLPKLKAVKASEPKSSMASAPSVPPQVVPGVYGYRAPLVPPPGSAYPQPAPTNDLLPPQAVPCPAPARPASGWVVPAQSPSPLRPVETHTAPSMPEPVAPTLSATEFKGPPLATDPGWPVVRESSFLRELGRHKPERQLFTFGPGLFGSQ